MGPYGDTRAAGPTRELDSFGPIQRRLPMANPVDARTSADEILSLERAALDRWGKGDPDGFLELYAADITYFDPVTALRIDGHPAMAEYYRPWVGKIHVARYEMLNPRVVVGGDLALLTYNLVNYLRDAEGV